MKLDPQTGRITGVLTEKGEYIVTLRAQNALGAAERKLKIICGPQIGLTPAMGWNSWNCFASAVTAEHVKAAADAMVKSGLINHGWTYINIDDYWEVNPRQTNDPTLLGPATRRRRQNHPQPAFPGYERTRRLCPRPGPEDRPLFLARTVDLRPLHRQLAA